MKFPARSTLRWEPASFGREVLTLRCTATIRETRIGRLLVSDPSWLKKPQATITQCQKSTGQRRRLPSASCYSQHLYAGSEESGPNNRRSSAEAILLIRPSSDLVEPTPRKSRPEYGICGVSCCWDRQPFGKQIQHCLIVWFSARAKILLQLGDLVLHS